MADEDRAGDIAKAVDHLLQPGETWVIRCREEDGIEVVPEGMSVLASANPELYGRLLKVSEQLSSAGGAICIWGPLMVLVLCLGLHLNWFESLLGENVNKLRSVWLYIVATVVSFFLFGGIARAWESVKYRQYRDGVLQAIDRAGLTPHRLIADIEGDDELEHLADQLKADPHIV